MAAECMERKGTPQSTFRLKGSLKGETCNIYFCQAMAEKRRLQADIEKTLKRVEDGIEDFDQLLTKIDDATTPAQKEKLELELKRDIKKLQRFRDQIKNWLSATDVKDKIPLEEARRNIEKEMEKFKICEKSFKIKAFSKEGLAQQAKIGPHEAEREKHRKWIREDLDRLSLEVDSHETEIEKYKSTTRKGRIKTTDTDQIQQIESWIRWHKWHIQKLELVLRKMENEEVDMSVLDDIKDGVKFHLESFQDSDYFHDEELYAPLGLEDSLEDLVSVSRDLDNDCTAAEECLETSSLGGAVDFTLTKTKKSANATPPIAPAAAAGGGTTPSNITNGRPLTPSVLTAETTTAPVMPVRRPRLDSEESHATTTTTAKHAPMPGARPSWSPPVSYAAATTHDAATTTTTTTTLSSGSKSRVSQQEELQELPQSDFETQEEKEKSTTDDDNNNNNNSQFYHIENFKQQQLFYGVNYNVVEVSVVFLYLCVSVSILIISLVNLLLKIIDHAHSNLPNLKHRRYFRYYQPKVVWSTPPASFPKYPLKDFASQEFFSKLDLDTLFFTFYHQQGTYQQYLAARELKRQNWRYHRKYLTWFQPQSGPKIITDQSHRGAWIYFDSDAGWCSRLKHDFTFEFAYLEDEKTPINATNNNTTSIIDQPINLGPSP